jgi:hypothetical protein
VDTIFSNAKLDGLAKSHDHSHCEECNACEAKPKQTDEVVARNEVTKQFQVDSSLPPRCTRGFSSPEQAPQSDPKGRHERSEVISLLMGIASPACGWLATASPDCFASLAMTCFSTFYEFVKLRLQYIADSLYTTLASSEITFRFIRK